MDRISLTARRPESLPRADRRPPTATRDLDRGALGRRCVRPRLPRAARAREARAQGTGMGAHRQRAAAGRGTHRAWTDHGRRSGGRARRACRSNPREARLDTLARGWPVKRNRAAWWFVAPALAVIGVFFFLPVLAALALSITDFDIYALADLRNLRLVGLRNYFELLQRPLFWQALGNTFYFVVIGVPLSIAISLGSALLLHSRAAWFKGFFRTALFAPVVTTLFAAAVVSRYLFNTRYGWLNYALGGLGIAPIDWLGDPHWAMPAIIVFAVWKNFGYNMIILLAGLQAIPAELYEAARSAGASAWRQVPHLTPPHLPPLLLP